MDAERFKVMVNENSAKIYGSKSGSLWSGNDLLRMKILIKICDFWEEKSAERESVAEIMDHNAPNLGDLLSAIEPDELLLPDSEILKKLKNKGVSEAAAFYCGLSEIQKRPPPKSDDEVLFSWDGRLRPGVFRQVQYANPESSEVPSDDQDATFIPDFFDEVEEQRALIIDEAGVNDTAVAFIRMVLMAMLQNRNVSNGKPFPAAQRSPGKYHKIPTTLGTYTCWTDGSIVCSIFNRGRTAKHSAVAIAEVEVKRSAKIQILPQHIAQLNAHMYNIALAYKGKKTKCKKYEDIPESDRTLYIICWNGDSFRVGWTTYNPRWLDFIFGPFSQLGNSKDPPTQRESMTVEADLDFQTFHVTDAYDMSDGSERIEAAELLVHIAFAVHRIGHDIQKFKP
ncbi:hypothetical protein H0H93_004383 [Arthromyces matolae]|nr:hypothetical protein H0H93_004383 [Arthromyces matolae]